MELFGESDVEAFSETSSDDQDDIFSIYGGHAQSILSSLEDSIGKIDDFLSFERGFLHGDIVCSVENSSGQMGRIVDVEMFVDLENVFGKLIKDVNSSKLKRMRSILIGDYVIHGPWIGRVERVVDNIGILFDDGMKCEIMATEQANLLPLSPNLLDDSLYPYHPGQRVKVSLPTKSYGWLHGISRKKQNEGTVFSVAAGLVYVDWISSAMVGFSTSLPPPTSWQEPRNLTILSCFPNANWQLGDWCVLPSTDENCETSGTCSKFDDIFSIVKKKIKVGVMWQDGSCSTGLDSHSLFPVSVVNAHDFFPGQFVLEKTGSDDLNIHANRRWGFVRSVDAIERTVKVKWRSTDGDGKDMDQGAREETVSAYELLEHPDFCFNISDIVLRSDISRLNDLSGKEDCLDGFSGKKDCNTDFSGIHRGCFLSCIGNVIGLDGDVEVQWASGATTKVGPYEILRIEKDDGSVAAPVFHEEHVSELNYEVEHSVHNEDLPESLVGDAVNRQAVQRNSRFFGLSQVAMGFLSSIAANFFRSHDSSSLPQSTSCAHASKDGKFGSFDGPEVLESCDTFSAMPNMAISDFDAYGSISLKQELKQSSENTGLILAENKGSSLFRQFDVVRDCSDHHFLDGVARGVALSQMKKGWLKKVQQEWSLLENDLPETIYVRIYEERMDLLRAAIVGAPGTPYHDGLFFFDIFLPPDYPHVPPLVHYHSGGLRLNPNLYESGKVCLSLLNTWTGSGSEVWNPKSSTILQVLLSLQALVLNAKPYFNEAGYDKQIGRAEGEKNSVSYNENAYLGACKSILYILRNPPKHFEGLVKEHFARRSQHILSACKAYMEGAPVGFETIVKHEKGNSTGFKIMLAKLFPKLVEAFTDKGIDCRQFI